MQSYPNNISLTSVEFAISSSTTRTGSFIANFSTIAVSTASIALNITGAAGTNGSGYVIPGPKGPKGITGVTGPRGLNVFLLSGSWNTSVCGAVTTCYTYSFATTTPTITGYTCDEASPTVIYSTDTSIGEGAALFYDELCNDPIINYTAIGGLNATIWSTDGSGLAVAEGSCETPTPPPGGGGSCSGFCNGGLGDTCGGVCICVGGDDQPGNFGFCTDVNQT